MMMVPIRVSQVISKLAVANRRGLLAKVSACLVQSHGVEGREHPNVGQNGCIILIMAVTVRRNVHNQADMEGRPPGTQSAGIFGHLAAKHFGGVVIFVLNGVESACPDAAAAALAQLLVDDCLAVSPIGDSIASAFSGTALAPAAHIFINLRLALLVLLHFAGTAAAAHADVLECSAETGHFMAFEV